MLFRLARVMATAWRTVNEWIKTARQLPLH